MENWANDITVNWKHTDGAHTDPSIEGALLNAFRESINMIGGESPSLYEGRYKGYSYSFGYAPEETASFPKFVIPKEENLMYVYDVVVVSKKSDRIALHSCIVARSKDAAKLIALAHVMRDGKPTDEEIDDYHFAISQVGDGYIK
jgi:hypothetical protein